MPRKNGSNEYFETAKFVWKVNSDCSCSFLVKQLFVFLWNTYPCSSSNCSVMAHLLEKPIIAVRDCLELRFFIRKCYWFFSYFWLSKFVSFFLYKLKTVLEWWNVLVLFNAFIFFVLILHSGKSTEHGEGKEKIRRIRKQQKFGLGIFY